MNELKRRRDEILFTLLRVVLRGLLVLALPNARWCFARESGGGRGGKSLQFAIVNYGLTSFHQHDDELT